MKRTQIRQQINKVKKDRQLRVQFLKFIALGVMNTAVSLIVIYVLMKIGLNYRLSNFIGYIAGLINSFIFNNVWVFKTKKNLIKEGLTFIIVFALCYGVQYLMLLLMVERYDINKYVSQFLSMGIYTFLNFILNRIFTFKNRNE